MASPHAALVTVTADGLYCPQGPFHIDRSVHDLDVVVGWVMRVSRYLVAQLDVGVESLERRPG